MPMLSDGYVTARRVPVDIPLKKETIQIALILISTFSSQYLGLSEKSEKIALGVDILLKKETGPDC